MPEETKVEETAEVTAEEKTEEEVATEAVEETPVVVVKKKQPTVSPEQLREAHKELQGSKATEKKKIKSYNHADCVAEINRLNRAGHQFSKYYRDVQQRAAKTA